jgi:tetratricopeptide (TPR) repeat protein
VRFTPVRTAPWGACALAVAALASSQAAGQDKDRGAEATGAPPSLVQRMREDVARFLGYPHFERAYRFVREKRLAEAVTEFESGLAKNPREHSARLALADVLHELGRHDKAERELERLAEIDGLRLALLQRRLAWHRAERPVVDAVLDALIEDPQAKATDRTAARRLRVERSVATAQWERARIDLEPLLADNPRVEDWLHAARVWGALSRATSAQQAIQQAAALAQSPAQRIAVARALEAVIVGLLPVDQSPAHRIALTRSRLELAQQAGDLAAEASALAEWQQLAPDDIDMLRAQRESALRRGAHAEALNWARRAARAGGSWHDQRSLGHLLQRRGEPVASARAFESALLAQPPRADQAALWRELGYARAAGGAAVEAAAAFEGAARIDGSLAAWRQAAKAWADAGRPAQALYLLAAQPAALRSAQDERQMALWTTQIGDALGAAVRAEESAQRTRELGAQLAAWREAVNWHAAAGDAAAYRRALQAVAARVDAATRLALAETCMGQRDPACAVAQLQAVLALAPSADTQRRLVDARLALGDRAGAAEAWGELARWKELPAAEAAQAYAQRAELLRALGQPDAAIVAYRAALGTGAATSPMHESLAQMLLTLSRPAEALVTLRAAQPSPAVVAQILRTRVALEGTAASSRDMERDEQAVLDRLDQFGEDERVEMLTLIATLRAVPGRWEDSERLWREVHRLRPSAEHARRLAQVQMEGGRPEAALATLQPWLTAPAVADDSQLRSVLAQRLAQAGYAHHAARRDEEAARQFEAALSMDSSQWSWRRARAYALARSGRGMEARGELRQAIDQVMAEGPGARADLWQLREQNRLLNRGPLAFTAYESVRGGGTPDTATSATPSGAVPSQGGLELLWQPSAWDFGPERAVQLTGRVFWSHRGSSLAIDADTLQASVGLRAKPLTDWPAYAEVQRLQALGSASNDDWLVRLSAGWSQGTGPGDGTRLHYNYSTVYIDVGRYLRARRNALYLEARQGRSWRLADDWVISPHLVVAGRGERPDLTGSSYSEWGAGVSLRHVFGGTRYETPGSSVEFLVQYKSGIERVGKGWVLTSVLGL